MRVLFIPFPLPTHYLHQASLAWAFRSAGHDVRIASAQAALADSVVRSGMTAVPVGGEYDLVAAMASMIRGQRAKPLRREEFIEQHRATLDRFGQASEAIAHDLVEFNEWWRPDLVITDPLMSISPVVSERAGVPLVRQLFGIDQWRLQGFPGSGAPVQGDVRAAWPDRLVKIFDRFGVEVRADYAARTVDPCPLSIEIPQLPTAPNRVPIRYVPYNGPGVLPQWLTRPPERRRVLFTWGTVATALRGSEGFQTPHFLAALAELDVEVVATLGATDREMLGEVPAGVRIVDPVPYHLLLPTCDVIFHHGGGGALLTAAALGVPQVICPQSSDQGLNATQVASAGAGVSMLPEQVPGALLTNTDFRPAEPSPDEIRAAVTQALHDDSIRKGADWLREEIRAQPSPSEVVSVLEELVDG
jgi:UDP:flavonoid glycosyltransferase YjiC (YdhE family)